MEAPQLSDSSHVLLLKIAEAITDGAPFQSRDADLTALAELTGVGLVVRTGDASFFQRTIVGTANQVVVTNGDGYAGNPTLSLPQSVATSSTPQFQRLGLGTPASATHQLTMSGGTVTTDDHQLDSSVTWNSGAVTFTGWKLNVTNTASNANSNLINLQVDGVDRFNFTVGGVARMIRQTADNSGLNLFLRKRGQTGDITGAIANGATIGAFQFSGWNGAAFATGASIILNSTEAWTGSALGTTMDFQTIEVSTTTLVSTLTLRGARIGFLGAGPVVRQAGVENVTNNVTAGGTDGTIANYTDLIIYANDAAAIRNDIYQLARSLAQCKNALRLYGLLT